MTPTTIILTLTTVISVSVAQALVKHGMNRIGGMPLPGDQLLVSMQRAATDIFVIGGFLLILMVVPLWLAVLSRLDLSVSYPLASFGFVLALVLGAVFFKETITPLRMSGMFLVILGVLAISKSQ